MHKKKKSCLRSEGTCFRTIKQQFKRGSARRRNGGSTLFNRCKTKIVNLFYFNWMCALGVKQEEKMRRKMAEELDEERIHR